MYGNHIWCRFCCCWICHSSLFKPGPPTSWQWSSDRPWIFNHPFLASWVPRLRLASGSLMTDLSASVSFFNRVRSYCTAQAGSELAEVLRWPGSLDPRLPPLQCWTTLCPAYLETKPLCYPGWPHTMLIPLQSPKCWDLKQKARQLLYVQCIVIPLKVCNCLACGDRVSLHFETVTG